MDDNGSEDDDMTKLMIPMRKIWVGVVSEKVDSRAELSIEKNDL